MKRLFTFVAASIFALVLTGCGEEAPKPTPVTPETTQAVDAAPADAQPAAEPAVAPTDAQPATTEEDKGN